MPLMLWVLCRWVSLSELSLPPMCLYMLVSVLVYAFCFQMPCSTSYSLRWTQQLMSAPLKLFGSHPGQAYVHPGDGYLPTPGMHQVAAASTTSSKGSLLLLSQLSSSHSNNMVEHTAVGAWQSHTIPLPSLHGRVGLLFQAWLHWLHLMTWSTLNLWWMFNLMILVW